jgi:hypothetical protein
MFRYSILVVVAYSLPVAQFNGLTGNNNGVLATACKQITPLTEYQDAQEAQSMIQQLCTDPKILQLMKQFNWKQMQLVGELHPQRDSKILGVNRNNGQSIKLRLRNKTGAGWRTWDDIYDTWLHELTHNSVSAHAGDFDAFRKKLELLYFGQSAQDTTFTNGRKSNGNRNKLPTTNSNTPIIAKKPDLGLNTGTPLYENLTPTQTTQATETGTQTTDSKSNSATDSKSNSNNYKSNGVPVSVPATDKPKDEKAPEDTQQLDHDVPHPVSNVVSLEDMNID